MVWGAGCYPGFKCFGCEGVTELAGGCGQAVTTDSFFSVGPRENSSLSCGQYQLLVSQALLHYYENNMGIEGSFSSHVPYFRE